MATIEGQPVAYSRPSPMTSEAVMFNSPLNLSNIPTIKLPERASLTEQEIAQNLGLVYKDLSVSLHQTPATTLNLQANTHPRRLFPMHPVQSQEVSSTMEATSALVTSPIYLQIPEEKIEPSFPTIPSKCGFPCSYNCPVKHLKKRSRPIISIPPNSRWGMRAQPVGIPFVPSKDLPYVIPGWHLSEQLKSRKLAYATSTNFQILRSMLPPLSHSKLTALAHNPSSILRRLRYTAKLVEQAKVVYENDSWRRD